jgi:hypothetical protein
MKAWQSFRATEDAFSLNTLLLIDSLKILEYIVVFFLFFLSKK